MTAYRSTNTYREDLLRYDGGVNVIVTPAAVAGSATLGATVSISVTVAPAAIAGSAAVSATASGTATVVPAAVAGSAAVAATGSGTATVAPAAVPVRALLMRLLQARLLLRLLPLAARLRSRRRRLSFTPWQPRRLSAAQPPSRRRLSWSMAILLLLRLQGRRRWGLRLRVMRT